MYEHDTACMIHPLASSKIVKVCNVEPGNQIHGFLYGRKISHPCIVTATRSSELFKSGTFLDQFLAERCYLPIGMDPLGIWLGNCDLRELSNVIPISMESRLPTSMVVLNYLNGKTTIYSYNRLSKRKVEIKILEQTGNHLRSLVKLRVCTDLVIKYEYSNKHAEIEEKVKNAMKQALDTFADENVFYSYTGYEVIASRKIVYGAHKDDKISSLGKTYPFRGRRPRFLTQDQLIEVAMLSNVTRERKDDSPAYSPVILYEKIESTMLTVKLPVDVILYVDVNETFCEVPVFIHRAVTRQMFMYKKALLAATSMNPPSLRPDHFKPHSLLHPVMALVDSQHDDSNSEEWRRALHEKFMITPDRPCFRMANQYLRQRGPELISPHKCVPLPNNFQPHMIAVVKGYYTYHHYMQDNFDDNKWGCAYRSLQTLMSWFILQGYNNIEVPTHREIQKCLVELRDKPPAFVGSKQWIGSSEVGFVLNEMLKIEHKIIFVSSGEELCTKGRELLNHFETQGTPVMIGGGVLAHTILGVAYNTETGAINYLILDPHYTGDDNVKTVVDKGWCGWKDNSFWDTKAYYNMCMPQRPNLF